MQHPCNLKIWCRVISESKEHLNGTYFRNSSEMIDFSLFSLFLLMLLLNFKAVIPQHGFVPCLNICTQVLLEDHKEIFFQLYSHGWISMLVLNLYKRTFVSKMQYKKPKYQKFCTICMAVYFLLLKFGRLNQFLFYFPISGLYVTHNLLIFSIYQ